MAERLRYYALLHLEGRATKTLRVHEFVWPYLNGFLRLGRLPHASHLRLREAPQADDGQRTSACGCRQGDQEAPHDRVRVHLGASRVN